MVALSGYRCELYDDELGEWARYDRSFRVNGSGSRVESLWLNPAAVDARRRVARRPQASLFDATGTVTSVDG